MDKRTASINRIAVEAMNESMQSYLLSTAFFDDIKIRGEFDDESKFFHIYFIYSYGITSYTSWIFSTSKSVNLKTNTVLKDLVSEMIGNIDQKLYIEHRLKAYK